jgi:hypothetical protein
MEKHGLLENHTAGIGIVAFVVAVAISMGYYQFVFVPQANEKPVLPAQIVNPPQTTQVTIIPGSSNPSQAKNFVPKQVQEFRKVEFTKVFTLDINIIQYYQIIKLSLNF